MRINTWRNSLLVLALGGVSAVAFVIESNPTSDLDPTGVISTYSTAGPINTDPNTSPFFHSYGTNGRTCNSCHQQSQGWSISTAQIQATFNATGGLDPLFQAFPDGAVRPDADVSTADARAAAFSLLLQRGLIRIGDTDLVNPPAVADYTITSVSDPYGYATPTTLSFFRRPLPATNVAFLAHVMWDGREDHATLDAALQNRANDATLTHAQAAQSLTAADQAALASFMEANFTAQANDQGVGSTTAQRANGGPIFLAGLTAALGSMNLFDAWTSVGNPHRESVARGQALFNGSQVINHNTNQPFSCSTCHNVANVGSRIAGDGGPFVDLNLADAADAGATGLPVYTVVQNSTNATRQVTDLGRGLITGQFAHVGQFKVPVLRGLAARAPYFHNGSRATLLDVVNFYDGHFNLQLTNQQKSDLVAFLLAL